MASGTERTTLEDNTGLDTGELGSGDSVDAEVVLWWQLRVYMRGESQYQIGTHVWYLHIYTNIHEAS